MWHSNCLTQCSTPEQRRGQGSRSRNGASGSWDSRGGSLLQRRLPVYGGKTTGRAFRLSSPLTKEMQTRESGQQWFALRVKSRCEKVVAAGVHHKGFEEFLPLYRHCHRWSDRFKSVEVPLFQGYVFCRLSPECRLPLLTIPGALHFVGIGKTPIPIDDTEIATIQTAVRADLRTEPWPFLDVGQRVRLEKGPLAGLEGFLIQSRKQHRMVVSVTVLRRSVAVEIEQQWVRPPEVNGRSAAGSEPALVAKAPGI